MALRFRKRVKVMPGVHLNISKSGVSTTVGPRGASVNIGKGGVHANLGIPGSGLSYRTRLDKTPSSKSLTSGAPPEEKPAHARAADASPAKNDMDHAKADARLNAASTRSMNRAPYRPTDPEAIASPSARPALAPVVTQAGLFSLKGGCSRWLYLKRSALLVSAMLFLTWLSMQQPAAQAQAGWLILIYAVAAILQLIWLAQRSRSIGVAPWATFAILAVSAYLVPLLAAAISAAVFVIPDAAFGSKPKPH